MEGGSEEAKVEAVKAVERAVARAEGSEAAKAEADSAAAGSAAADSAAADSEAVQLQRLECIEISGFQRFE